MPPRTAYALGKGPPCRTAAGGPDDGLRRFARRILGLVGRPSGRRLANRDAPRLHRLGHNALEFDAQQAVLEDRIACFNEVGELKAPLE